MPRDDLGRHRIRLTGYAPSEGRPRSRAEQVAETTVSSADVGLRVTGRNRPLQPLRGRVAR